MGTILTRPPCCPSRRRQKTFPSQGGPLAIKPLGTIFSIRTLSPGLAEYYENQYQHRALRAAKRRAAQLGYQLVLMSNAQGVPLNPAAVA